MKNKNLKSIRVTCQGAATLPLEKLSPLQGDLKVLPEANHALLRESILRHGITFPFFVWRAPKKKGGKCGSHFIIDAHQRDKVLQRLAEDGYAIPEVPVVWIDALDEQEAKEKILLCNSNYGEMTEAGLGAFLMASMLDVPTLQSETVLPFDLAALLAGEKPEADAEPQIDRAAELQKEWHTATGQLWSLGDHRLICGDCTDAKVIEKLMGGGMANICVTDPPYGVEYDPTWRDERAGSYGEDFGTAKSINRGKVLNDDRSDWLAAFNQFKGDVIYVWHGERQILETAVNLEKAKFLVRNFIVWAKPSMVFGRGNYHSQHETCWYAVRKGKTASWAGDAKQTTLWEVAGMNPCGRRESDAADEKTGHGTQKPIELMLRAIRNHEGDCYDPFLGSGTTLIACENLQRRCYGCEISPGYIAVILQRYQDATGKEPKLLK